MTRMVGVDIGGTHTDLIVVDTETRRLRTAKVPTTPGDQAVGLMSGLAALQADPAEIDLLVHGTTVATNAVIERKGARCGLITTAGFRDVLELRRRDRPDTYGLTGGFVPLIERRDRQEVKERIDADGAVLVPLDPEEVRAVAAGLRDAGCEVLVICFLHAYLNPIHEQQAAEAARAVWLNDCIVVSSEILPVVREFERCSTTAVSGYVQPLIGRYLASLGGKLREGGYRRDLLVVQSSGGLASAAVATRFAANTILSGPAAGVTAACAIGREMGIDDLVSCDMGGTSLDVCIIRGGEPGMTQTKAVSFGIPLGIPMLDVDAIGAGGGSLARLDGAGLLQVGPQSAGAVPGPVCFGRGGTVPTVTDANLILGLLDPAGAIGRHDGSGMDVELARKAVATHVAAPLGVSVEVAAEAIVAIASARMAGHIRRKLLEKGLDPRRFSIMAFGGAGPLHANRILRDVEMAQAIIPFYPGITSAMGCVLGRLKHHFMRTVNRGTEGLDKGALDDAYAGQIRHGMALLQAEGVPQGDAAILLGGDMCYRGQSNTIPVPFPGTLGALSPAIVRSAFDAAYRERYGQLLDGASPVLVNARVTAESVRQCPRCSTLPPGPPPPWERPASSMAADGRRRRCSAGLTCRWGRWCPVLRS